MLMPPMSDPSEPSERMERADNPSKGMKWALILGGIGAAGAAAYFLTRSKRTPLPSAEQIAAGKVPGVTVNATTPVAPSQVQIGLAKAANPMQATVVKTSVGPSAADYAQKLTDIMNWSRPILAFALGVPMQQASMAGYRRLNGPLDFVQQAVGTVSKTANAINTQVQTATTSAQTTLQKAEDAAAARLRAAAAAADPDPFGWGEVQAWVRSGRLPSVRSKPAWNAVVSTVGGMGSHWFNARGYASTGIGNPNYSDHSGAAGTCYTGPQLLALHGFTRQMYDLWTRGGGDAQAIPQETAFAPRSTLRNKPFRYLQAELNKG